MAHIRPPEGGDQTHAAKSVSESHLARQVVSTGRELAADVLGGLPWYAAIPLIGPYFAKRAACNKVQEEIIQANNDSKDPYEKGALKRFLAPLSIDHLVLFQQLPHLDHLTDFNSIMQASKGMHQGEFRKIMVDNYNRLDAIMRIQADEGSTMTLSETFAGFLKVREPMRAIEERVANMLSTYTPRGFDTFVSGWIDYAHTHTKEELNEAIEHLIQFMKAVDELHETPSENFIEDYGKLTRLRISIAPGDESVSNKITPVFTNLIDINTLSNTQIAHYNIHSMFDPNDNRCITHSRPSSRNEEDTLSLHNQHQPLIDLTELEDQIQVNLADTRTEIYIIHPTTGESRCVRTTLPFPNEAIQVAEAKTIAAKLDKTVATGKSDIEEYKAFLVQLEKEMRLAMADFSKDAYFANAKAAMPDDPREAIAQLNLYQLENRRLALLPEGKPPEGFVTSLTNEQLEAIRRGEEVEIEGLGDVQVQIESDEKRMKVTTHIGEFSRISYHKPQNVEALKVSPFFERDILLGIAHYYAEGNG